MEKEKLEKVLGKYTIFLEFVDCEATLKLDVAGVTNNTNIVAKCSCGNTKNIKISSFKRTLNRKSVYRCFSCSTKSVWESEEFRKKQSLSLKKFWQSEDAKNRQSITSKRMWENEKLRSSIGESSKKAWENIDKRRDQSEKMKRLWKDPEHRQKYTNIWDSEKRRDQSEKMKRLWKDPEYINKQACAKNAKYVKSQSIKAKNRWKNLEYKNAVIDGQKALWEDPDHRRIHTERMKEVWADPEYAKKQKYHMAHGGVELRRKIAKKAWEDPEYRSRVISGIKKTWASPEFKEMMSQILRNRWKDPDYRNNMAIGRSAMLQHGRDSILERTVQRLLDSLDVSYDRHFVVGPWEFDLFVPHHNLLIECQGDYWHSSTTQKSRDSAKFTYVSEYFPEYRILYFWEREFVNPDLVKKKLISELFHEEFDISQIDFDLKDLFIQRLNSKRKNRNSYYSAPEEFLQSYHYAQYGRAAKVIYGAFLSEDLIAVCKFSAPVRKEVATSMGLSHSEVLELDRFCIHPRYQKKNFASWFISRVAKLVFETFNNICCLVSFADSTVGHYGTIYRASNWKFLHEVKPSYHYLSPEGFIIHKKTLYNFASKAGKKERAYANEYGYLKIPGKKKLKFVLRK